MRQPLKPNIDIKTLNARTGMDWSESPNDSTLLRSTLGALSVYLGGDCLMVGIGHPVDITVWINDGDVESSIDWLTDPDRLFAHVRSSLAAMTAAVGAA